MVIPALLILASMISTMGCNTITLYPLDKQDIVEVKEGTVISGVTVKHGYFLADEWIQKVAKARVK